MRDRKKPTSETIENKKINEGMSIVEAFRLKEDEFIELKSMIFDSKGFVREVLNHDHIRHYVEANAAFDQVILDECDRILDQ